MSTPVSGGKGKACCVSGCLEARMHRNYCARHHNAALGKADRPVRPADLEPPVSWIVDALTRGVDAIQAAQAAGNASGSSSSSSSSAAAAAAGGVGGSYPSPGKPPLVSSSSSSPPPVNSYLQLLTPLAERLLENIRNPSSTLPAAGSLLDVFSFSVLGAAPYSPTASLKGAHAASLPRPPPATPITHMDDASTPMVAAGSTPAGMPPSPAEAAFTPSSSPQGASALPSPCAPSPPYQSSVAPIVDIRVQLSKQRKKVPLGFELLDRSLSGKYEADVNKGGNGKSVMLCIQRAESKEEQININDNQHTNSMSGNSRKDSSAVQDAAVASPPPVASASATGLPAPITSLSVIFRDACEEPPYGFHQISRNTLGGDANLNHHTGSAPGKQAYLCVHRGEGAPIVDLSVIFHDKKETLPAGWHEVKHTPFGNRADLNAALNAQPLEVQQAHLHQQQQSQAVYIAFRPNVTPVLQTYPALLSDPTGLSDSVARGHLLHARVLALLTAILYSYDQKMVLHALEGFMKLSVDTVPALLLNRFIQCVCDAAPCFQTYFTTQAHSSLLKFLLHTFKSCHALLNIDTLAKMLEVCFLTRHEDKQGEVSEKIIQQIMDRVETCKPCVCQLQERRESQQIAMNAVAGGEGHSKPSHRKGGTATSTSSASASGLSLQPQPSPASSGDSYSGSQSVSSILCTKCQWNRAFMHASPWAFCRELATQLAENVVHARELEADVKAFQRHTSTGVAFRTDVARITTQLFAIDQQRQAHIAKAMEAIRPAVDSAAAGAGAGGMSPISERRPVSARQTNASGGRGSFLASGLSSLSVTDSDAATSTPPTPSVSSSSVNAAFAFDEIQVGGGTSAASRLKLCEKDRIWVSQKDERFLCVAALVCAKFASEPVAFGLVKSEQLKRKTHALRLLFYILHHGVYFFRSTPGGQLLVRRFICPALMSVCVTDSSLLWRLLLQTFTVLYEQYRSFLMIELGVWFDHILLSLLESHTVSADLKKDVLDMWAHILGRGPEHIVHLFYCYDNAAKNWNIFERLNTVLARIAKGEQKSFVPIQLSASAAASVAANAGVPAASHSSSSSSGSTADQRAELIEQQEEALQRQALKLLVHILHMMAQWAGVPGLKRSPDTPSQPLLSEDDQDVDVDDAASASAAAPGAHPPGGAGGNGNGSASGSAASASTSGGASNRLAKLQRASRIDTWSWRHDKQKQDAKHIAESLKLARTDSLKSALQYLRLVDPAHAHPKAVASFLFSQEGLDKSEVGDFLGSCGDKFMDDAEHEAIRHAYMEQLDFTGLLFDQALRLFLCDSGFRLPGEAQKIDRMLEAFCQAYCRDNPSVFRNSSSCFIVAFALVMLNTDLHDARLKAGTSHRQPMTEAQFISNLRGVDDNHDFPRSFLETLYRNIAAASIEWKEKSRNDAMSLAAEEKAKELQSDAERMEEQAKAVRKTYELSLRRALAYLKNWAAHEQGSVRTSNTMIVAAMFEVSWYRSLSAITYKLDNVRQGDVELLHTGLDGLAYGSAIAIALGLHTERQAFSFQLAQLTFIERHRGSSKATTMRVRLVEGEHLKQEWYRPFNLLCEKNPARACRLVFDVAHDLKAKLNYERRQARLRSIESDFAHEIVLVDPSRSFVKEGQLLKLANSSAQKKNLYTFMLFNDLILYASEGVNSKWKCHRVIHLSLCRLEDLRGIAYEGAHAFRIVSPQKSFVVFAPTKEKKASWISAILQHLEAVMEKRRKYILEAQAASAAGSGGAGAGPAASPLSPSDEGGRDELMRRYSTYIGQSDIDLNRFSRQYSNSGNAAPTGQGISGAAGFSGSGLGSSHGSSTDVDSSGSSAAAASASSSGAKSHCKLCIRPWGMFRRKQKCRWCADLVCSDCAAQKCLVPGGAKKLLTVCDACYGVIKGMVGDNVPLLTVTDT